MSNDTVLDAGSGGDTISSTDLTTFTAYSTTGKLQSVAIYVGVTPAAVSTSNPFPISDAGGSLTVDGTVAATQSGTWNITNVSGTVSLPTGASTAAKQPALGTAGTASTDVITVQGIASMTALKVDGSAVTQPVSGTFWQTTQPVSIAATVTVTGAGGTFPVTDSGGSLTVDAPVGTPVFVRLSDGASAISTLPVSLASVPSHDVTNAGTFAVQAAQSGTWNVTNVSGTVSLPTGAATAAKQPALGTAGSASADVITVQGVSSMTPLLATITFASAQAVTQSGTWNIGTVTTVTTVSTVTTCSTVTSLSQWAGNAIDTNSGNKSAGTLRVVLATDQPTLTNKLLVTPDANSAINLAQVGGSSTATGHGTASGALRVELPTDGTGVVNQGGTWTVQPGNTANTTPWLVTDTPATSGGLSYNHITAAANNNKTQVKGSAGQLYAIHAINLTATAKYIKVFDKTSANVTAGTTSADYQFAIPANSTTGAGFVINLDKGVAHANGITVMITGAVSLTDNTSLSANDVVATFFYR